jgi:hypothetical protein
MRDRAHRTVFSKAFTAKSLVLVTEYIAFVPESSQILNKMISRCGLLPIARNEELTAFDADRYCKNHNETHSAGLEDEEYVLVRDILLLSQHR